MSIYKIRLLDRHSESIPLSMGSARLGHLVEMTHQSVVTRFAQNLDDMAEFASLNFEHAYKAPVLIEGAPEHDSVSEWTFKAVGSWGKANVAGRLNLMKQAGVWVGAGVVLNFVPVRFIGIERAMRNAFADLYDATSFCFGGQEGETISHKLGSDVQFKGTDIDCTISLVKIFGVYTVAWDIKNREMWPSAA